MGLKQQVSNHTSSWHYSLPIGIFLLTGGFWLLYWHVLSGFWRYDDHDHLAMVHQLGASGLHKLFTDKATWSQVSVANFCPINVSFYGLWDFGFHLNTQWAYFSHLFNLYLLAIAFFLYVYRYMGVLPALLTTFLWFSTQTVYEVANELMSNHYVLASLFGLLSLHCFYNYNQQRGTFPLILGSLLAFLAALTKEIFGIVAFAPLIGQILYPPTSEPRPVIAAARSFVPSLLALVPLAIFGLWRSTMLNGRVGGYKPLDGNLDFAPATLFGAHAALPGFALIILGLTLSSSRGWRALVPFVLLLMYGIVPGLFMASMLSARYWILPSLVLCFFLAYAWPRKQDITWARWACSSCIVLIASIMTMNSLSAIPRIHQERLQSDALLQQMLAKLQKGPLTIEVTDATSLTVYRQARNLCLISSSTLTAQSCQMNLALGGTLIEDLRDFGQLAKTCERMPDYGWKCVSQETFTGLIKKDMTSGLDWQFEPCSNGGMKLIFNHDGRTSHDWPVADIGCKDKSTLYYNWIEMMAIIGMSDQRLMITPLMRVDLSQGATNWQTKSLLLEPLPRDSKSL